jgi:hypothetical protein
MKTMFPFGQIVMTPGAIEALEQVNVSAQSILQRHILGDWGDVTDSDKRANELAVEMGGTILSAYKLPRGIEVWVLTEPDRTATTVLLPNER